MNIKLLALLLASSGAAAHAVSINYTFRIDGFPEGAFMSGYFTGSDLNGDGILKGSPFGPIATLYEVTDFGVMYSGDSRIGPYTPQGLDFFGVFFFNLQTSALTFAVEAQPPGVDFTQSLFIYEVRNGTGTDYFSVTTSQAPQVRIAAAPAAVPESGCNTLLLGAMSSCTALWMRKRLMAA